MKKFEIAVIQGDGIGKEVVPAALEVLHTVSEVDGSFRFEFVDYPWNCDYYQKYNKMMPDDALSILKGYEAIFLGAIGNPQIIPDHISAWELLLKIRREFEQHINIRPAKFFKGLNSPLVNPKDFDLIIVRENSEGEYGQIGGLIHKGMDQIAIQNSIFTRKGTERAMRYAFELAKGRRKHVTSATKSNALYHSMPFWDDVFNEIKTDYPSITANSCLIDALAAFFVSRPESFDVIVASNLYGDILSDIGGAIMGSIGIAPSANINLNGKFPSMFEPVHGSAPDIAGRRVANPIGQIWTAKLLLDHFGLQEAGNLLLDSIGDVIEEGLLTPDLGGNLSTFEVSDEISKKVKLNAK